eukprot:1145327-Pelagomonas_calceolata.AAC.1
MDGQIECLGWWLGVLNGARWRVQEVFWATGVVRHVQQNVSPRSEAVSVAVLQQAHQELLPQISL